MGDFREDNTEAILGKTVATEWWEQKSKCTGLSDKHMGGEEVTKELANHFKGLSYDDKEVIKQKETYVRQNIIFVLFSVLNRLCYMYVFVIKT